MRVLHRASRFISAAAFLAAACRISTIVQLSEPEGDPPLPTEQRRAAELPTEAPPTIDRRPRVIAYDRNGISAYDPETAERRELLRSPLWLPEVDLSESSSTGLIAIRTVSEQWVPIDLALTIVSVSDGRLVKHIPLFSPELQDQLTEGRYSLTWLDQDWAMALLDRWFRPHWSPDGQSVVFAAAIHGPSADVYLYDIEHDELRRLTEEFDQAVMLGVSPDGEWVAYVEGFGFEWNYYEVPDRERIGYFSGPVRAVSISTGRIVDLYQSDSSRRISLVGWYSPTEFALTEVEMDLGMFYLYRADIVSRSPTLLYGGGFEGVDLDAESRMAAFTVPQQGVLPYGVSLVEASSHETLQRLPEPETGGYAGPIRWYPEVGRFFTEAEEGIAAISPTGEQAQLFEGEYCLPRPSPDGRLLFFWGCGHSAGLSLYYSTGEWYADYDLGIVQDVVWGGGANEVYVVEREGESHRLHRLTLSTGEIELIDPQARQAVVRLVPRVGEPPSVRSQPTELAGAGPTPTPAALPPAAPRGELHPDGPWLLQSGYGYLVASNLDGSGLVELLRDESGPHEYTGPEYRDVEATDGGWIAVRSGPTDEYGFAPNLLVTWLPATQAIFEIPLFSRELASEMFGPQADWTTIFADNDVFLAIHGEWWFDTFEWSPDGRLLAFVAALDGDSADLYVLDTESADVRRITDGPNQPRLLGWSPDSRWVVHQEVTDLYYDDAGIHYRVVGTWAAAADGGGARRIRGVDEPVLLTGWLSGSRFTVLHHDAYFETLWGLELVDLDRGWLSTLHPGAVFESESGPAPGMQVFLAEDLRGDPARRPLYLLSGSAASPQLVDLDRWLKDNMLGVPHDWAWSPELGALMIRTAPAYLIAVTPELELVLAVEGECVLPLASPDGRWLAFGSCADGTGGLRLHNLLEGGSYTVTQATSYPYVWRPDSSGVYYAEYFGTFDSALMLIPVPDGAPQVVQQQMVELSLSLRVVGGAE